jgi:site-specific recombinase XerD
MNKLSPENESYYQEYQLFLLREKKEESTIKMYLTQVQHFMAWLELHKMSLCTMNDQDFIHYRDELFLKGVKVSTNNKWISILSSFFKWSINKGYIHENFAEYTRYPEEKKDKPRWLSIEEEQALLGFVQNERNPFKKARNDALLCTMLHAGLRIEEVSHLCFPSLEENTLVLFDDKQEVRRVPIIYALQTKLLEWLKYRSHARKTVYQESSYLFVTERSGHMQPRSIQFVVEGYSEKLGFPVTAQMLRHTFCRRLVEKGLHWKEIQRLAGHKSILSTYRYYDES